MSAMRSLVTSPRTEARAGRPARRLGPVRRSAITVALAVLASALCAPASIAAKDQQLRVRAWEDIASLEAYGPLVAWVERDSGAWTVWTLARGKPARLSLPPLDRPFLDVGPGPDGRPVVVFERCAGRRCDVKAFDPIARRERTLVRNISPRPERIHDPMVWRTSVSFIDDRRHRIIRPIGSGTAVDLGTAPYRDEGDLGPLGVYVTSSWARDDGATVWELSLRRQRRGRTTSEVKLSAAYGESGWLALRQPVASTRFVYVTRVSDYEGDVPLGDWALHRIDQRTGAKAQTSLPNGTENAVAFRDGYLALSCPPTEDGARTCTLRRRLAARWRAR